MSGTTVHEVLAKGLAAHGARTLFGLLGDANLFLADAFVRAENGRFVPATFESNAVQMALGYSAMTGEAGVATVTHGPAVSNAVTGLIEGVKSSLPLVLLAGDTRAMDPGHPQAVRQRALVEAAGAGFVQLRSAGTASEDLAIVFRRARAERRPVVLNMPVDLMWEPATFVPPPPPLPGTPLIPGDGAAMDAAVGILAAARRPLVLAGRGAIHARAALIRLADRIGAPLATTLKAKGLFQGQPYDLGVFGTLSTPAAGDAIGQADCILAFGASLNRFTSARGGYLEGRRVVQVDDDPQAFFRHARVDAALLADPELAAERLIHWLDEAEIPSSRAIETLEPRALAAPHPAPRGGTAPGTVDLTVALSRLDAAVPRDRVFVSDGGRFMGAAWTRIGVTGPENMLLTIGTGAIGLGMGHAIGAAVARPGQTVLLVTGDGGFMMSGLAEFVMAVNEGLDLIVVVCNDEAYGAEYVQMTDRQMDPAISTFRWPSFAEAAQVLGGQGIRVTSEPDLDAAEAAIAARRGPLLIELMLDPAAVPRLQL